MNAKGQVMSLDFLISIIAITLAIGLLLQFAELKVYNEQEEMEWLQIKEIAETASGLLVNSPEVVCELVDTRGDSLGFLPNCIPKVNAAGYRITKQELAIPAGFECKIDKDDAKLHTDDCIKTPLPADKKNIYAITRTVVFYDGTGAPAGRHKISKAKLEECMQGLSGCGLEKSDVTLWVWKV